MHRIVLHTLLMFCSTASLAQNVNIPDPILKNELLEDEEINTVDDGEISVAEAEAFTDRLRLATNSLTDLTGLEAFINLTELEIYPNNGLTEIDVSANTALTELILRGASIAEIDLSNNTQLETLSLSSMGITSIDLSNHLVLDRLSLSSTNISSLDISANTQLTYIFFSSNKIKTLDLSSNTLLESIRCRYGHISTINLKNGANHLISTLDLTDNLDLNCVQVDDATSFAASWPDAVDDVLVYSNLCLVDIPDENFKDAVLSHNPAIDLDDDDEISILEAAQFSSPLEISSNDISDLTGLESFTNITALDASDNGITLAQLGSNGNLQIVDLSNNSLEYINIRANKLLEELSVNDNHLEILPLRYNVMLTDLDCSNNSLTNIDLGNGNNHLLTSFNALGNPELSCVQVDEPGTFAVTWDAAVENTSVYTDLCIVNVPDANFKNALLANASINLLDDGEISLVEASSFTGTIDVRELEISDLTGIEMFSSVTWLICQENDLTSLDVSNNRELTYINFGRNDIDFIDVSQLPNLEYCYGPYNLLSAIDLTNNPRLQGLDLDGNDISSLNLLENPELTTLYVWNNELSEIDLSANTKMTWISIGNNDLTELDLSNNVDLGYLSGYGNNIATLDLSNNLSLSNVSIYGNDLTSLTLGANTELETLNCFNNNLSSLDVSQNTGLVTLSFYSNQISEIDLSNNPQLDLLSFSDNLFTYIDLSGATSLRAILCRNNSFTSLDFSGNSSLESVRCENNSLRSINIQNGNNEILTAFEANDNPNLFCIQVDDASQFELDWSGGVDNSSVFSNDPCVVNIPDPNFKAALLAHDPVIDQDDDDEISFDEAVAFDGTIEVSSMGIFSLEGIEAFTRASALVANSNILSYIDLSDNTDLQTLSLDDNVLTSLDLLNNSSLTSLSLSNNQMSYLEIEHLSNLASLNCSNNLLDHLSLIENTLLEEIDCSNNYLQTIDLTNGTNELLTGFDATENSELTCIQVDDATAFSSSWPEAVDDVIVYNELCIVNIPDANFKTALLENEMINLLDDGEISISEAFQYTGDISVTSSEIADITGIELFPNIGQINLDQNQLTSVDVSHNRKVTWMSFSDNEISEIDLSRNEKLTYLSLRNNQISTIFLDQQKDLESLYIGGNNLTELEVGGNQNLELIDFQDNQILSIDLQGNSLLEFIHAQRNNLTSLDVSNNPDLTRLFCEENQLLSLNLKNGSNELLDTFQAYDNPNLTCIQVDDAATFATEWGSNVDNDAFTSGDCIAVATVSVSGDEGADAITTINGTLQMEVTIDPVDATFQPVTWSVDDSDIATINQDGLLTAVSDGSVFVRATAQDGSEVFGEIEIAISVHVTSITVSGTDDITQITTIGETLQMEVEINPIEATDQTVTWSVDDTDIATIDLSTGLLTSVSEGVVLVTATANDGSGIFGNLEIVSTIHAQSIAVDGFEGATTIDQAGGTLQMTATVSPIDTSDPEIEWSVDDEQIATIDSEGLLTAVGNGTITIYASAVDGSNVVGESEIIISGYVATINVSGLDDESFISTENGTLQMVATVSPESASDQTVTWSVSDELIATISTEGLLTAVSNGAVIVTATSNDGSEVYGTIEITVDIWATEIQISSEDNNTTIEEVDGTLQLEATVLPESAKTRPFHGV